VLEEIQAQRERGYRKIVVAGQSFGGRVALEVGTLASDLFATIAMAPGMETTVGNSRTQAPTDERLRRAKVERLVVVFPAQDELFGNIERGRTAAPVLANRERPYLLLDETAGLKGHAGGTGGNFTLRYGRCLETFLSAPTVPSGAFSCPATKGSLAVARNLVPKPPAHVTLVTSGNDLAGLWYGTVGESIVSWAPVDVGAPRPGVLYTHVSSGVHRGGGVYAATVEGGEVKAVPPNRAVLAVTRRDARTLDVTYTPTAAESNFGTNARRPVPLHGTLMRAED